MHLILTHSNTDFDGLAAQLAAARLYPGALPLLQAHLRENLRIFLALAQDELPFVREEDLPDEPITQLTLVDTDQPVPRALIPDPPPPTLIIDHHPIDRALEPHEQLLDGEAGATTTLLVEQLIDTGMTLTPVEATLLLLGIYEDTGSLTFSGTRRTDLLAAAWLLGQGARLAAVSEFLGRPLTTAQQQVYHDLLHGLRTEQIAGWPVVIATAQIDETVPELSSLAHQIRDLYAPAVTLLVIGTSDEGTQLIARADANALDAGALMAHFGGGGHPVAAAAFVEQRTPQELLPELEQELRRHIRPALTAADLMTTRVKTVPLTATIAEAAAIQMRSGHSTLPVVDDHRAVHGLIGRRELDRAMHHDLGAALVSRYMWRGPHLIAPETPLAEIQKALLDDEGRISGRLLVVDQRRHLLGILTRADLLRTWEGPPTADIERHTDTIQALEQFLPATMLRLLQRAATLAEEHGWALYLVGGTVRDMLLGLAPGDLDILVEGDAVRLANALSEQLGGQVRSHAQFGTATVELTIDDGRWTMDHRADDRLPKSDHQQRNVQSQEAAELQSQEPGAESQAPGDHQIQELSSIAHRPSSTISLDFVTARTEYYEHPAALPEVEAGSLRHDLHRRDFTINTLAICLNPERYGQLYDFYGGRRDLRRRLIRVLHNLSFIDDPTRILRATRLAARLDCTIEPRTRALIADALEHHLLERTTPQRITAELLLTFGEPAPERALALMDELGVLQELHPALVWTDTMAAWFAALRETPPAEPALAGLALLTFPLTEQERTSFAGRYHLGARYLRTLNDLSTILTRSRELDSSHLADSQIDWMLHGFDDAALSVASLALSEPASGRIACYQSSLRRIEPAVDGNDLIALGLIPGPHFRTLLEGLRAALLDQQVTTRDEQLDWVKRAMNDER